MVMSHERFVAFWDRTAPRYDAASRWAEQRFLGPSRPWVCSRARGRTLELGVGTAANLTHYRDDIELTGVDWSREMLRAAHAAADRTGRPIALHQADAADLPFPDDSFDSVVATFALCCIPDERGALGEAVRVLRPGGRLLLADHVAASAWPVRLLQHAGELVTVPLTGEHWTRRPAAVLEELGIELVERERTTAGILERVHAIAP